MGFCQAVYATHVQRQFPVDQHFDPVVLVWFSARTRTLPSSSACRVRHFGRVHVRMVGTLDGGSFKRERDPTGPGIYNDIMEDVRPVTVPYSALHRVNL